jgi:Transposase DDE domain
LSQAELSGNQALELYRGRWQIELVFKRLKSILQLGHLRKIDPDSAISWIEGKLFVALLLESLLRQAESFFPGALLWNHPHRSRWREQSFLLHLLQQAVNPPLSLPEACQDW